MSLQRQVGDFKRYEEYVAAGATSHMLEELEVKKEESLVEDEKDWEEDINRQITVLWQGEQLRRIDSPLTLEQHVEGPLFFASESPFDVLDEMLAAEEKIERLIGFIRDTSNIQFAEELDARLIFLCRAAKEEDPDEVPISPESLSNFIAFLQNTPNLRYPDVVLTPSNEILAQWRTAPNRHFAVVFLPTGEARYVIFTPNRRDPDKIDRLSGITSTDTLMETAEPHGVLEWASR